MNIHALASLALSALGLTSASVAGPTGSIEAGKRFPGLVMPDLEGHPRSIDDFRGKKVVLHVFASW